MSPAVTAIEAALSAHMVSEGRGDALSAVQHVLTAAVGKRYSGSAVGAHLEVTPFLMLLASNMADRDRSRT